MSRNRSKFGGQGQLGSSTVTGGSDATHHHHHHHHPSSVPSQHGNHPLLSGNGSPTNQITTNGVTAPPSKKNNNNVNSAHSPGALKSMSKGNGKKNLKSRPDVATPFKHGVSKVPRGLVTTIAHYGHDAGKIGAKVRYQESQGFSPSLTRSAINSNSESNSSSVGKISTSSDLKLDYINQSNQSNRNIPSVDSKIDSPIIPVQLKPKKKKSRPPMK